MRYTLIIAVCLFPSSIASNYSVPAMPVASSASYSSVFNYNDIGHFRELKEKIEMLKSVVKDICFDPTDTNSDSVYFTTSTVFDIANANQRFVTSWGCTASDGTDSDIVGGYVQFKDGLGIFDEAKVVLVGLDQTNVKIQTTSFDTNDRISAWCLNVLDNNTGDSVAITQNLDIDGDGNTDTTIPEFIKERSCS